MSLESAIQIIENNLDNSDFFGPIDSDLIKIAEKMIDVEFPLSYIRFLEKFGAGDIAGIEIYGIIRDPRIDKQMVPNGIWLTAQLRKDSSLPKELIVVSETGYGPYYVIDTSQKNINGEAPVLIWGFGKEMEKVSDSFGEFLFELLLESGLNS